MPPTPAPRTTLLRDRGRERAAPVTNVELFFDLVYVFAFTQLSELLYELPTWTGGAEAAVIFVALWWSWHYTAWATGWVDPDRAPVAALLAVLMIASLVMAASLLDAFSGRGGAFAVAYVAMQLLRSGFMVWVFGVRDAMGRNYAQLLAWSVASGIIWIIGGILHDPHTRLMIWSAAAAVDMLAPLLGFRLPGVEATPIAAWTVAGGHLAERCQLLLMIAFGESFMRIGEAWAARHGTFGSDCAFIVGFLLVVGLWSVYFLHHAAPGARSLEQADEGAAHLARSAYMYAHAAMVGAVVVVAVAIHRAIEAPHESVTPAFTMLCTGGPALYLAGIALSKRLLRHGSHLWPLLGVTALALVGAVTSFSDQLVQLITVTVVAAALAAWAQRSA